MPPTVGAAATLLPGRGEPKVLVCKADAMRIGILGGTGPAGTALGARLASVGYEVTLGSRSKYRAMELVDGILAQWPDYDLAMDASDNEGAAAPTSSCSRRRGTARRRRHTRSRSS